jgi:hypothetical protein
MSNITSEQQIIATHLQPTEYQYHQYSLTVKSDITPEMLTDFRLWEHVAHKLQTFDEIRVVDQGETYMAKLLVTFSDKTKVGIKVLDVYDLTNVATDQPDISHLFCIKQKGQLKWCLVELNEDGTEKSIIQDKIQNEATAQSELDRYVKQLTG